MFQFVHTLLYMTGGTKSLAIPKLKKNRRGPHITESKKHLLSSTPNANCLPKVVKGIYVIHGIRGIHGIYVIHHNVIPKPAHIVVKASYFLLSRASSLVQVLIGKK